MARRYTAMPPARRLLVTAVVAHLAAGLGALAARSTTHTHTHMSVKAQRRAASILPRPDTRDLDTFIKDLWHTLKGKCWPERPIYQIFNEYVDIPHPPCYGTWAEFGVFKGATASLAANWRAKHCGTTREPVYGFDTFEGLPESWYFFKKGDFDLKGDVPDVPANVELVKGLFSDSLPRFIANKTARAQGLEPFTYLHIDCDLYVGARDALEILNDRIQPGALLLFDELVNYEGYKEHEVKALWEWVTKHDRRVQVLGKLCDPNDPEAPFNRSPTVPKEFFVQNATFEQSVAFIVVQ